MGWILLFIPQLVRAQQPAIIYQFERDTVDITSGQTFSNRLIIENRSATAATISRSGSRKASERVLLAVPETIELKGGEKKSFPVKYLADRGTISQTLQPFTIAFSSDAAISVQEEATFYSRLRNEMYLAMSTDQSEYYLNPSGGDIRILLRVANTSLVPLTFRLLLTEVPEGLEFSADLSTITLEAGAQQLVPITARSRISGNISSDYVVSIQALANDNKQLALRRVRILTLSHVRRFGAGNVAAQPLNNAFGFRYTDMGHSSSFYHMHGYGNIELAPERTLEYRFNGDYYQDFDGLNMYDTYLNYQDEHWGIKAGNIYEDLDYPVNGRGIKGTVKFNNGNTVDVYGVQNNYMLVSHRISTIPGANIAAASYKFNRDSESAGQINYLHSKNRFYGLDGDQLSGKALFRLTDKHLFNLEGGFSMEKPVNGTVKQAVAGGLNYNFNSRRTQISSINYFSTPYYTGLRRGVLQSDTRVTRIVANGRSVSARVSLLHNRPNYQYARNVFGFQGNESMVNMYEIGYTLRKQQFSMDIGPYFMQQKLANNGYFFQYPDGISWASSSARLRFNFNLSGKTHAFSLNADYGYTFKNTSQRPSAPYHSVRLSANYGNPIFGLNAFVQLNPYYLTDAFSISEQEKYRLYSIGPNTAFSAFKERLQVQAAAAYNFYGFSDSQNYTINGSARWRIKGNWALAADLFYTVAKTNTVILQPGIPSSSAVFNNRQIRLGIEKQFNGFNRSTGKRLQVTYFEDQNSNGSKDPGELLAEDITVKLNKEVAVTNNKGLVKFENLKPGGYTLYMVHSNGWTMAEPIIVIINKNRKMNVPLIKTAGLSGRLVVTGKSYLDGAPNLTGIAIHASDSRGKRYKVLTGMDGAYMFRLPPETYTVFIETQGMPFSIENPSQQVVLTGTESKTEINFDFKDERRKVDVKRF